MKSRRFALTAWMWKRRLKSYVEDVRFALTNPRAALNGWQEERHERRKERLEWRTLSPAERRQRRADVRWLKAALKEMRKCTTPDAYVRECRAQLRGMPRQGRVFATIE